MILLHQKNSWNLKKDVFASLPTDFRKSFVKHCGTLWPTRGGETSCVKLCTNRRPRNSNLADLAAITWLVQIKCGKCSSNHLPSPYLKYFFWPLYFHMNTWNKYSRFGKKSHSASRANDQSGMWCAQTLQRMKSQRCQIALCADESQDPEVTGDALHI